MNLRFLFIIVFTFFCNKAFGFEKFNLNDIDPYENIIVEDMFEPLKVTGDALPWQLFGKTKEVEDCTIDKDGFDYCLIKPIYDDKIKKYKKYLGSNLCSDLERGLNHKMGRDLTQILMATYKNLKKECP